MNGSTRRARRGTGPEVLADPHRRSFRRAVAVGVAIGTLVTALIGTGGSLDLFRWETTGDFYDAQASAWLEGRWDIGVDTLGIEAFFRFDDEVAALVDRGEHLSNEELRSQPAYMYQGPVPAVFRIPTSAFAPQLHGRLTLLSILVGTMAVGLWSGALTWEVRRHLRPSAPVDRREQVAVGAFAALITGGSSTVYLAAKPWVYHEALVWGVALCVGALVALVRYADAPSPRRLVALGTLTTACLLTRASLGLGPLLGVAVLGAVELVALARARPASRAAFARVAGLAAVGVVALGSYALVSIIKFRTLFSVPFEWQMQALVDPGRQEFLEVNGSFFSLRFVPTTLLQYFRPDAFRFSSHLPWIDFAPAPGPVLFGAHLDLFDRTSSIPSTLPAFVLLGVVALVAVRRGWFGRRAWRPLAVAVVAAAGSGLAVLPFGYLANRYVADFLPLMVIVAAIGLQVALSIEPTSRARGGYRIGVAALAATAIFGAWVNISHGVLMQRVYGIPADEQHTASFLAARERVAGWTGAESLSARVIRGDELPLGRAGDLFVVGDCDAMYLQDGAVPTYLRPRPWIPVERTEAGGRHVLSIRFDGVEPGRPSPIFSGESDDAWARLTVEMADDGEDAIVLDFAGAGVPLRSAPIPVDPQHTYDAVLITDPWLGTVALTLDDRPVFAAYYGFSGPIEIGQDLTGAAGVEPTFAGTIAVEAGTTASLCQRLVDPRG